MAKSAQNISPEKALDRLAALCSRSEQAESDLREKLRNWGISETDADAIIARLYEMHFLDRDRYLHSFVRDKFRFEGWGRIKIAYQLRQKGFEAEAINAALAEIDDIQYADRLTEILRSKARSVAKKPYLQAKASLVRFAASRGFEPAVIYAIIPKVLTNNGEDDEYSDEY